MSKQLTLTQEINHYLTNCAPHIRERKAAQLLYRSRLYIEQIETELTELREKNDRLSVLAVKHCPRDHHDWDELKGLIK